MSPTGAGSSVTTVTFLKPISDQLPPILLGSQTATDRRQLLVGEGHSAALLARYLDEAGFSARGDGGGKLYSVTHGAATVRQSPINYSECTRLAPAIKVYGEE